MPDSSNRRAERHRLVVPAKLRTAAGRMFSCMIRDISEGGALLRVPVDFRESGDVFVTSTVTGPERPAQIVWQDRSSIGIRFLTSRQATGPVSHPRMRL